jgi:16S rRNA (uracil1498-N3)-methyltransferase
VAAPPHAPFFFVDPASLSAEEVTIEGSDARHLAVVRRAIPGDRIRISDGGGRVAEAELRDVGPSLVRAAVLSVTTVPAPSPPVHVYQALAKGEKVDGAIRALVEIGVDRIVVFESGRSVTRLDGPRAAAAAARWSKIALEAAKQSHRVWFPEVRGPLSLRDAIDQTGGGPGLVAHPAAPRRLTDALAGLSGEPAPAARPIWVVVGPEGGLSDAEVDAFAAAGGLPVSLGDQILRTETASLVVPALVMNRLGRLG